MYLTFKSFQQLPQIPALPHYTYMNSNTNNSNANSNNSNANAAMTIGKSKRKNGNDFPIEDLAKHTPFPQKIDFAKASSSLLSSSSSSKQKDGNVYGHVLGHNFESIVHPAVELLPSLSTNSDIANLIVPTFYNPPIFQKHGGIRSYLGQNGNRLMTIQEAKTIGSYVEDVINSQRHETIFVAIASYRDFQCQQTIESILSRAKYPQRIRIAVIDQLDLENDLPCSEPEVPCTQNPNQILCQYANQIDFMEMDAAYAVGPVFARHLGHRMYRGEYFAMQCDAHGEFHLSCKQGYGEDIIIHTSKDANFFVQ